MVIFCVHAHVQNKGLKSSKLTGYLLVSSLCVNLTRSYLRRHESPISKTSTLLIIWRKFRSSCLRSKNCSLVRCCCCFINPLFSFSRLDTFRVAASDMGLVTNLFLEMYNSGQASKKWFLEKVIHARQILCIQSCHLERQKLTEVIS